MTYNAYQSLNGDPVPAVTSVLSSLFDKPMLYKWFKSVPATKAWELCTERPDFRLNKEEIINMAVAECDAIRDKAGDFGSRFHQYVYAYFEGKPVSLDSLADDVRPRVEKFLAWVKDHKFEPVHLELTLVSEEYGYAGTGDYFGKLDGKFCYIDWKTSKYVDSDTMPLQAAAYALAYEEKFARVVEGLYIFHIGPEEPKLYDFSDVKDESLEAWKAALLLWRWRNRNSKKWKPILKQTREAK